MSNYKTVFFTLGVLQIVLGLSMIIPIIVQFIYNEFDSSFISAGIISVVFGALFFISNLDHNKKLNLPQAFLLTALSWLSVAIFGSLQFIFSSLELNLTDSFFYIKFRSRQKIESSSGLFVNSLILGFNCYFWMFAFFFLKP